MNSGFKSQCVPQYRLLTEEQIKEIHRASLEILETVGVQVWHEEGARLLEAAGCRTKGSDIYQIPGWLVEECIGSAPSQIPVYNRKGDLAMRLGGTNIYYGLGTDLATTHDLETGETRRSCLQDVVNAAKVTECCDDVDFVASFAIAYDVPTNMMYIECVKAMMKNSTKPIFFTAAGREDLEVILQMASAIAGGEDALTEKPFIIHYSEPTPPLRHSYGALNKLFLCAEREIPICYPPGAMLGGSAPVTLAGAIAQTTAEALSGVVLHQLKHKGAPIISGFGAVPLDMSTSVFSYGDPGHVLTKSACTDLFHYYGIPMWSTVGSDSLSLDQQGGMELGISILMAALDGSNLIHDVGYLGQGLLGNPASILMSDEIISYAKRIVRGFEITPETLGVDVIKKVGPGGNYLLEDHTFDHFRTEQWRPKQLNRFEPTTWEAEGCKTYGDVLTAKTRHILATFETEPLPDEVLEKLDAITREAEGALANLQFTA